MDGTQCSELANPKLGSLSSEPVNVSVSDGDMEVTVVGKERWKQIQQLYSEGRTIASIARQSGLDRKTVRACIRKVQWTPYRREPATETLLSAHAAWLAERAPQVRYSARILFQELRASRGYSGGYDTVKNAVRPLRAQAALEALTQCRFETAPGEQAQVDWGQARVRLATGITEIHIFVMTLGYSRRAYAEGFEHERIGSLLSAHEHAFAHFGGRTAEILYDRMRTVVLGTEEGRARWNPTFEAFARHWGFEPRLCRPYRAKTKGKVESGVKYVKGNFLPGRAFDDLADFNEQLAAWLAEVSDVRVHGTTHQRPIERFAEEAGTLVPTPGHPSFVQALVRDRIVAEDWLIAIDTNRYSVPCTLIGKSVQVVRVGAHWQIRHQGALVAEHPVLPGRHQLSVNPEHGPGALARNARKRFATPAHAGASRTPALLPEVELRDLALYDQLVEARA